MVGDRDSLGGDNGEIVGSFEGNSGETGCYWIAGEGFSKEVAIGFSNDAGFYVDDDCFWELSMMLD